MMRQDFEYLHSIRDVSQCQCFGLRGDLAVWGVFKPFPGSEADHDTVSPYLASNT